MSAIKSEALTKQYNQFEVGASEFVWVDSTMFHNIENLITNFEDNEADERLYSNYTSQSIPPANIVILKPGEAPSSQ